jgi:hypothetical protein
MSRLGGFWIGMALISGVSNYGVKQMVQGTANELSAVQRKTVAEQKEIHELQADWTFLTQPELLADLNKRYIGLVPMSPKQAGTNIDTIPLRPPPPLEPTSQIAAATPIQEPAPMPPTSVAGPMPEPPQIVPLDTDAAAPSPAPTPAPVVRTAAAAAPLPIVRAATVPVRPASIDALFAQVAGDR